jgi:hypothetical protein
MSAIITNKLRVFNAQQFIESINEQAALWKEGNNYSEGDIVLYNSNLYVAVGPDGGGVSGGTPPTHTTGIASDGTVSWVFYNKSLYNNVYMAIGQPDAWTDDTNPPTPIDSVGYAFESKDNITAMKKLSPETISLAVPRVNWENDTLYTAYDHDDTEEIIPNGYVLVEANNQFNVYKCLNNSVWRDSSVGVQPTNSTVKPSGTPTSGVIETSDGYVWKFMYSIQLDSALKFLTNDYIPVKFVSNEPDADTADYTQWQIRQNAISNSGSIEWVKVIDDDTDSGHSGGHGYNQNVVQTGAIVPEGTSTFSVTLSGSNTAIGQNDFTGYTIAFRATGSATTIVRTISGYSYNTSANTASISLETPFATGEGGTGTMILAPGVQVDGDGTGFTGYCLCQGDQVSKVVITNGGTGYTNAVGTVVAGNVSSTLSTSCKVKPIVSPTNGHGFNPVEELGGYYAMVALKLMYDEQDTRSEDGVTNITESVFPVTGDRSVFRQISIISDPIDEYTEKLAYATTYRGPKHNNYGTTGQSIFDVKKGTGKVLYIENRQPVSRAIDQIEDIKVVFEF